MLLDLMIGVIAICLFLYYFFIFIPKLVKKRKDAANVEPLAPAEDVDILADEAEAVAYRKAILESELEKKERKIKRAKKTLNNE